MRCELFEPAMCAKIPSNLAGLGKFDFEEMPEVLIDVALGVVGTGAPEVLGRFVSVWRVDDICAVF
ncbi:hypothetical protein M405DRAFT_805023 [Rhizopogon salebrosus TDB-379]|nr:hypothetical protein M405DRAFT_805023 [Rhizopogon salebrosus TDB-379]